jgi:hypothetical protein
MGITSAVIPNGDNAFLAAIRPATNSPFRVKEADFSDSATSDSGKQGGIAMNSLAIPMLWINSNSCKIMLPMVQSNG